MDEPGGDRLMAAPAEEAPTDDQVYLLGVMAEIDEEVRRRRASGDLPARVERELDELFLEHSPVAGQGGGLDEALRMVDAAAFIDPVVPVDSAKSGGAAVKKGLRSLSLWYMGYVTHQVSVFATAVSRSLHLLDGRVAVLQAQLEAQQVPPAQVVEVPGAHNPDAWWVPEALAALQGAPGRVLHAASGSGWLVRVLRSKGVDAYGVDPRPRTVDRAELDGTDLRAEGVLEHLRAVEPAALGGVVLTGVVDPMTNGERRQLVNLLVDRLAPDGTMVVHSLSPSGWDADDAPVEADLASGRPLRGRAWANFLPLLGFTVTVHPGPEGDDYVAVAVLREAPPAQ
jgi:hypothetical protein